MNNLRSVTILCSIATSIIIVSSILGMVNLSIDSNQAANPNNIRNALGEENSQHGNLIIIKQRMSKTFMGNWVVKGEVMNSGAIKINFAVINVNFFDSNGNLLYSGPVNINNIDPGEKRDFEVNYYGPEDKLDSYKIVPNIMK